MEVYLVGGAVRDELLGLAVRERDWVVVGATPEELTRLGYQPVGREFPVFLHPVTHEEYALARLERKTAPGYRGFVAEFSPSVTLEQDMRRRDLTVNAMARSASGALIDPCGGRSDLAQRLLRHVSPAFVEDPVRVLRVARFAARFAPLGFRVAPQTLALMREMVANGEIGALVPERVWRELARALETEAPAVFFEVLQGCGALAVLLPEMDQPLAPLASAAALGFSAPVRFAALLAETAVAQIESLCERLRVPGEFRELALLSARLGALLHGGAPPPVAIQDPAWLLGILEAADAFRRPERFAAWLQVLQSRAVAAGVPPPAAADLAARFGGGLQRAAGVRLDGAQLATLKGPAIAGELRAERLRALASATIAPPP